MEALIAVGGVVMMLASIGLVVGLINPRWVRADTRKKVFQVQGAGMAGGFAVAVIAAIIAGPPQEKGAAATSSVVAEQPSPPAPAPEDPKASAIKQLRAVIKRTDRAELREGKQLGAYVAFRLDDEAVTASYAVFSIARDIDKFGRAIKAMPALSTIDGEVTFNVTVPTRDKYGNIGTGPAFDVIFDAAELRKVNYDTLPSTNLFGLAKLILKHAPGVGMAAEWCRENMKDARAAGQMCR